MALLWAFRALLVYRLTCICGIIMGPSNGVEIKGMACADGDNCNLI